MLFVVTWPTSSFINIDSFHMKYRGLISIHRLQRKTNFGPLRFFLLVPDSAVVAGGGHVILLVGVEVEAADDVVARVLEVEGHRVR